MDRKGWKTKLRGEVCANSRWTAVIPRSAPLVTPVMIPSWPLMCPSLAACGVPCLLQLQLEYLPVFLHRLCVGSRQHLWAAPLRPVPVLVLITMLSVGKAAGGREGGHRIQPTGSLRTPTPQPTWAHAPHSFPLFLTASFTINRQATGPYIGLSPPVHSFWTACPVEHLEEHG